MKKLIAFEQAGRWLRILLAGLIVFHLLVISGLVPPEIVWGGQLEGAESILPLEILAITLTAMFLGVTALRTGSIGNMSDSRWVWLAVWLMAIYFLINTLGNLASGVSAENFIFAPISLAAAILALRLAIE